ncbi:MAG TPA: flavodoxin-dependent (E)-4-hydroxy-3-methylbut-2-enyl-diphosphate synthase, partial [bacterium]|nr:flavodoxin-dependent (E)-4-hydroxy-3-methylbut-2-enyl-diphosphate synthase [bacterium]
GIRAPIKVAVMGCVVNGPGEAKEADIGVAGGDGKGVIFKAGKILTTCDEADIEKILVSEVEKIAEEMDKK